MCSSPRLLAAYHGLHRTVAPRHPPWTLFRLTIFSLAPRSSAIRFARRFHSGLAPAVALPRFVFPVPMDRLHVSFFPPPRPTVLLRATAAFSLPSSCQRTLACIYLQRWWRYGDLNPRPMACKATALATELYPQARFPAREQSLLARIIQKHPFDGYTVYRKGRRV